LNTVTDLLDEEIASIVGGVVIDPPVDTSSIQSVQYPQIENDPPG